MLKKSFRWLKNKPLAALLLVGFFAVATLSSTSVGAQGPGGNTGNQPGTPSSSAKTKIDEFECAGDDGLLNRFVICPAAVSIAYGIDFLYSKTIEPLLEVQPLGIDNAGENQRRNDLLYSVWDTIRNLANFAIIAALFAIIFSQVTNMGLNAYGAKKLLPKIIIGAILINLSYSIATILVDVFNILGYSIASTLNGAISVSLEGSGTTTSPGIIEGAAFGIAIGALLGPGLGGIAILLFILLLIFFFLFLLAAIFLLARQIFIVGLVVIAPLAFAAWMLPNTSKFFTQWWSLFLKLLALFPIIALLSVVGRIAFLVFQSLIYTGTGSGGSITDGALIPESEDGLRMMAATGMLLALLFPIIAIPFAFKGIGGAMGKLYGSLDNFRRRTQAATIGRGTKAATGAATNAAKLKAAGVAGRWASIDPKDQSNGARAKRFIGGYKAQRENRIREQQRSIQTAQEGAIAGRVQTDERYARSAAGIGGDAALARVRANANQAIIKQNIEEQQAYIPNLNRNGSMLAAYGFQMDSAGNLSHVDTVSGAVSTGSAAQAVMAQKFGPNFSIDAESAETLKFSTQNRLTAGNENGAKALATVLAKTGGLDSEMAQNLAERASSNPVDRAYVVSKMNEEAGSAGLKHLSYNTVDKDTGAFVLGGQFGGVDGVVKRLMQNGASTINKEAYADKTFGVKFAAAVHDLEATQRDTFRSELVKMDPRKIEFLAEAKKNAGIISANDLSSEVARLKTMREDAVKEFGLVD